MNPDCTYHVVGTQRDDHAQYARTDGTRAFTGAISAPAHVATLSASGRYVGSTNGSPTGGPYLSNDFANDPTGLTFWVCTVGGSPGTWVAVPGQTDTGWTSVGYTNSWVDFGGGFQTVQFRLIGGRVELRGTMKSGTINTAAFTLPVGHRPTGNGSLLFACNSNSTYGQLTISTAGAVTPSIGSNSSFSVDGVTFDTL